MKNYYDPLLRIENVSMIFGGLAALDKVNMTVMPREIHGLIGPNGSGKTTLVNIITGFYMPSNGSVLFSDKKISGLSTYQINHVGLGRTFQNINLFGQMTALENVITAMSVHSPYHILSSAFRTKQFRQDEARLREKAERLLAFVGLINERQLLAQNLPYGKQRLLEIARLLATDPELILLDEPVAGMNEQESELVSELIKRLRDERGKTILLIEHHMRLVMNICDNLTVLNSGKIIAKGTPKEIQNNQQVIDCYLGKKRGIPHAGN